MDDYGIYLSVGDGKEGFQIPVNPAQIEIKEAGQGETYTIISLGEINVIKEAKLSEISFESFFPAQQYPFVVADTLLEPIQYVNMIKKWIEEQQVVRFIMTGTSDINMTVSIENFTWREKAGAVGDLEYELSLKKYVYYAPKKAVIQKSSSNQVKASAPAKSTRPNTSKTPSTYTLKKGDTLWSIAQKYLGSGTRWREIANLNGISDAQTRKLPIGLVVKLPAK
jgi:nucleoid-associated protein YgaU